MTLNGLIEFKIGETTVTHLLRIGVSDTLYVNPNGKIFLREDMPNEKDNNCSYNPIDQLTPIKELNSAFCERNYDLISKRMEQLELYERESGIFTSYSKWGINLDNVDRPYSSTTSKPLDKHIDGAERLARFLEMYMRNNGKRSEEYKDDYNPMDQKTKW